VIGCDATITVCGQGGNFELNAMMPILALKLLEAIEFSAKVVNVFTDKCVIGVEANEKRCQELVELSLAMGTALAPVVGYDRAAEIAHQALASGKTIRQVALEQNLLPEPRLNQLLDPRRMTEPGIP
jgi:fumarate hydratase class II